MIKFTSPGRIVTLFAVFALFLTAMPYEAQAQKSYSQFFDSLTSINKIKPLQHPDYDTEEDILNERMLDNRNKVIGEVRDVIISNNGSIASLLVDFNRLRLGSDVFINYREMRVRKVTNGYALNLQDEQIEMLYPSLLASIETASGKDGDSASVRNVVGASVKNKKGQKIGEVKHVLFSSRGGRAEALYVAMMVGVLRGKKVAIPYAAGEFKSKRSKTEVILNEAQESALKDFAKDN